MLTRFKLLHSVLVGLLALSGATVASAATKVSPPSTPGSSSYRPLIPARVLDTRTGLGGFTGRFQPGILYRFRITGRGGLPSGGVSAVALTATAISPLGEGSLRLFKAGSSEPKFPTVDFVKGDTGSNLAAVRVSNRGKIDIRTTAASHVTLDVVGWYDRFTYLDYDPTEGTRFTPVRPRALLDTRKGLGAPVGPLGTGQSLRVQATGVAGVPSDYVNAVALGVTALRPEGVGALEVYPANVTAPGTTTVAFSLGRQASSQTIARLSGTGRFRLKNWGSPTHVRVEILGYYSSDPTSIVTGEASLVSPQLVLDTRTGAGGHLGKIGSRETFVVPATGLGQVPSYGVAATLLTVTADEATKASVLTIYSPARARPRVTSASFGPGRSTTSLVVTEVDDATGTVAIYNRRGKAHLSVQVLGWYPFVIPPPPTVPGPPPASPDAAGAPLQSLREPTRADVTTVRSELGPKALHRHWTDERLGRALLQQMPGRDESLLGEATAAASYAHPNYAVQDSGWLGGSSYSAAVGRLYYDISGTTRIGSCSGSVVARNLVVTAAHCVVGNTNFAFAPRQIGTTRPFGLWYGSHGRYFNAYNTIGYSSYSPLDYAFVVFPPDYNNGKYIGDKTGKFDLLYNSQAGNKFAEGYPCQGYFFGTSRCNGYDSDTSQAYVWYCKSPVGTHFQWNTYGYDVPSWEVGYGCYTNGGMSGGPVFEFWNGRWYVSTVVSNISNCVLRDGSPDPNRCDTNGNRWFSYNSWSPYFDDVWVPYLRSLDAVG